MVNYLSWRGISGEFGNASDWIDLAQPSLSGALAPGATDSADISAAITSAPTITGSGNVYALTVEGAVILNGHFAAHVLRNSGNIQVTGASITVATALTNAGTLTFAGGSANAETIANTGAIAIRAASLNTTGFVDDSGTIAVSARGWLNDATGLAVGDTNNGVLSVTAGGLVSDTSAMVGDAAGVSGAATVSGAGALWWSSGPLFVGDAGAGTLAILNHGTVGGLTLYAGHTPGAAGTITVAGPGSLLYVTQAMLVGDAGSATLAITAGGQGWVGTLASIGAVAKGVGSVTIDGAGSMMSVALSLAVGEAGAGALLVQNGGAAYAQTLLVADAAGATGSAMVSGAGALLELWQAAYVGRAGNAALSVANGGAMIAGTLVDIGTDATGSGTLTVASFGSALAAYGTLVVGDAGRGVLSVQTGAQVSAPTLLMGNRVGSHATLTVSGAGSLLSVATALLGGNWSASGGSTQVTLSGGGELAASGVATVWAPASVTLAGGALVAGTVTVNGRIAGNGTLEAMATAIGYQIQNNGTISASGGTLDVIGGITGAGVLSVAPGATLLLQGSVSQTQAIGFLGGAGTATLALGSPAQVSAPITGLTSADRIELVGVTASRLLFSNGVLTAIGTGGPDATLRALATLRIFGSFTASSFVALPDGRGDTLIALGTAPPITPSTAPQNSLYLQTHRFFATMSPWNTPIAPGAATIGIPGITSYKTGLTTWSAGGGNVAIYYARDSDPLAPVYYNPNSWTYVTSGSWARMNNSASTEQQIMSSSSATNPVPGNPYSTQKAGLTWNGTPSGLPAKYNAWQQAPGQTLYIHVPAGAVPTPSSDGQTVIIQQDGTAIELYSPILLSSGAWVSSMFSATNALSGTGTGADNGRTASMIENYAGVLRDTDVTSGIINHALALAVPPSLLTTALTGPALAFDSAASDYSGTLAMGSHLALPAALNLGTLGLTTALGQEIALAAQTYGLYIVDRGGSGISIVTQNAPTTAALKVWTAAEQADLNAIFHHTARLSA